VHADNCLNNENKCYRYIYSRVARIHGIQVESMADQQSSVPTTVVDGSATTTTSQATRSSANTKVSKRSRVGLVSRHQRMRI